MGARGVKTWTLNRNNSAKDPIRVIVWKREGGYDPEDLFYIEIEGAEGIDDSELLVVAALWLSRTLTKAVAFLRKARGYYRKVLNKKLDAKRG